ncbi:RNA polymerase sigma factor RpoD/SigA [Streptomyces niveus]|uniref:RNA polymerase sigma factor RpoD/SigA n=1 Tax=Streptomyces niveus TaxID=193462 RepID=UPI0035E1ADC4
MTGFAAGAREDRARDLRAAVGPLLLRLNELAVRGVIPRESFLAATAALTLDMEELDRVEQALRGFGLRVSAPVAPPPRKARRPVAAVPVRAADPISDEGDPVRPDGPTTGGGPVPEPGPPSATVPPGPGPGETVVVGPRVESAAVLVRRYGALGPPLVRVVAGVARLCGLTDGEREQLSGLLWPGPVVVPVPDLMSDDDAHDESAPPLDDSRTDSDAETSAATPSPEAERRPHTASELALTVVAAERLLAEQRLSARPAHDRLLTEDEATGLAVLMRGGTARAGEPVTEAELAALEPGCVRRRAYEALVEHNVRLVHEVCKKYVDQGLEYEDLFHHGVLGLMHAVCKFDTSLRYRLSTYAYQWLRQAMSRAVADFGSAIRVPVHFHDEMRKVATTTARLRAAGQDATPGDVAVAVNLTVTRVEEILRVSRVTDSLDRELFEGANLGDILSYERPVSGPEEVLSRQWSRDDVEQRLLDKLDTKSADIMRRRAGFVDGERQTLGEIGAVYGVTRERIRQIETKARMELRLEIKRLKESSPSDPDASGELPKPQEGAVPSTPSEAAGVDLRSRGVASAAARYLARLGRKGLQDAVGIDGALIICAVADGRLPPDALSRRLAEALLTAPVG